MEGEDKAESGVLPPAPAPPATDSRTSERLPSVVQVPDVVREVIRQLAPEELPVFDSMADEWLSDGRRRWRTGKPPGAAVGFGVESLLLTQLAFPIITGAIGEVLGGVAEDGVRLRIRRRAARRAAPAGANASDPGAEKSSALPAGDVLSSGQARTLHEACERHARVLGMSAARATLLADAVLGALASRPGGD
jgi:hypothetical protein